MAYLLQHLLTDSAARRPGRLAVASGGLSLTYPSTSAGRLFAIMRDGGITVVLAALGRASALPPWPTAFPSFAA